MSQPQTDPDLAKAIGSIIIGIGAMALGFLALCIAFPPLGIWMIIKFL
ncbi:MULTISPECIES: hypothetical protein [Methylobacterium]|uniref:Uncharacterized protein n=2 Tax=Methylobacterium TaxID=407 RepID=A0A8H8X0B5_9HYPH|nr:hypothetical protein [Methylobacterium indicum]BCM87773.1 hypothetical protein mvi_62340 [Methylobacterium indicum]